MDNYISKVLSRISGKSYKKQIEAELQAHIDDRIEFYINSGYDAEAAAQKAAEHMGDTAKLVGDQLNLMVDYKFSTFLVVVFTLVNLFALYALGVFGFFSLGDSVARTGELFLQISSAYLIYTILEIVAAIKIKRSYLAFCSVFLMCYHALFMFGYVPFVFPLYEIITGKGKYLGEIFSHNFVCDKFIYMLSMLIDILIIAFLICIFVHIVKFNKLKNGKHSYRNEKIFNIINLILIFLILSVTLFTVFSSSDTEDDFSQKEYVEGFYFIESDEKTAPSEIEHYDYYLIRFKYQVFLEPELVSECVTFNDDLSIQMEYLNYPIDNYKLDVVFEKYDNLNKNVSYEKKTIVSDFYTDKKYFMVVPMLEKKHKNEEWEYYPDFADAEWVEVKGKTIAQSKERQFKHGGSYLEYKIQIIPN